MQQEEKSTFLYSIFENAMNLFHIKYSTTPQITTSETPLEKEDRIFTEKFSQLKKISPKLKGTKLYYMIMRYEETKKKKYI